MTAYINGFHLNRKVISPGSPETMVLKNRCIALLPMELKNIQKEFMNHMNSIEQDSTVFGDEIGISVASTADTMLDNAYRGFIVQ